MSTWFTSDLHLGHRLVTRLRGFGDDTDAHDAAVMDAWRRRVHPGDTVWVLGDVCLSRVDQALEKVASLPGTKHLVSGNHDRCHPSHGESHQAAGKYLAAFASVQPFARRQIAGRNVLLSHFPYSAEAERNAGVPDKHAQWRLPDLGEWLVHGHTHGEERLVRQQIHVGLDAWGLRPVPLAAVAEMMGPA